MQAHDPNDYGGDVMPDQPPSDDFMRALLRHTFGIPQPAENCAVCGAPLDDGQLHTIPGNNKELCSHIKGM